MCVKLLDVLSVPSSSSSVRYENHCFCQDISSWGFVKADKFTLLLYRYTFMEDGLVVRLDRLCNRRQLLHHNSSCNGQLLLLHNGKSRLWLFFLFLCGDVELNLSPVKSLCGYCVKGVRKNQYETFCDSCLTWYHTTCLDMPNTTYLRLAQEMSNWDCYR